LLELVLSCDRPSILERSLPEEAQRFSNAFNYSIVKTSFGGDLLIHADLSEFVVITQTERVVSTQ
jgi:serine/threonine-protein kinase RIO1